MGISLIESEVKTIENEGEHIDKFIEGFESIVTQYRSSGNPVISGCEGYAVGVLKAEGLPWDITCGFENFITDGIKKLYEMITAFFKGIWEFFFGKSKAAKKAEADARKIEDMARAKQFDEFFNKSFDILGSEFSTYMTTASKRVKKSYTDLGELERKIKSDFEAEEKIGRACGKLGDIFSYDQGTTGGDLMDGLKKYNTYLHDKFPEINVGVGSQFVDFFQSLVSKNISLKYAGRDRVKTLSEFAKECPIIINKAESVLKAIEGGLRAIKSKAERSKDHKTEYEAQQALKATNIVLRRLSIVMGRVASNISIIKNNLEIIVKNDTFG